MGGLGCAALLVCRAAGAPGAAAAAAGLEPLPGPRCAADGEFTDEDDEDDEEEDGEGWETEEGGVDEEDEEEDEEGEEGDGSDASGSGDDESRAETAMSDQLEQDLAEQLLLQAVVMHMGARPPDAPGWTPPPHDEADFNEF